MEIPKKIEQLYQEAIIKLSNDAALLHVAEDKVYLVYSLNSEVECKQLPFGYQTIPEQFFKNDLPNDAEIEAAITLIEDELMPLAGDMRKLQLQLASFDEQIHELASYADADKSIGTGDVERIFSRLAAIVMGRPASMDVLPATGKFISYTLIVREIMHHLAFPSIIVLD